LAFFRALVHRATAGGTLRGGDGVNGGNSPVRPPSGSITSLA